MDTESRVGPIALGTQFGPKYVIQSVLGHGAFATTYLARHTSADRTVVLKIFPSDDPDRFARFEAEVGILAHLDHPNIVRVFDHGVIDGLAYLELEWVDGATLEAVLADGPLAHADAIQAGSAIAEALRYAHIRGIIHRDLKPANVLVPRRRAASRFAEIKLTDFGVAGLLDVKSQRTRAGMAFGTPLYMSPEQVVGKPQTAQTDVYALGLLLYEMLSGRRFRRDDDTFALFEAILGGQMPASNWGIPPRLEELIRACVQLNPADRPSVDDVLSTLREGEPPQSSPRFEAPRPAEARAIFRPGHREFAVVFAILLLMLIGLVGYWRTTPAGTPILRLLVAIALTATGIGAGFWIRGVLDRPSSSLRADALALVVGAKGSVDLTATIAMQLTDLVGRLRDVDERILAGTVALMLKEYTAATDAKDRQSALMNVVSVAEKLGQRLSPWYVRYKDVIASAVAVAGAVSGLLTAYGAFHAVRKP